MTTEEERELCRKYASRIRGYGLRRLRDPAAAEDLVQQVLLVVLQAARAGRIENPERMGAYVLGTCRYAVRDMQRSAARQRKIAEQNAVVLPDGCEPSWSRVDRERLEHCLMALDERARAIGDRDWFVGDLPTQADASAFGLLAVTIRSNLPTPVCRYARSKPNLVAFVDRALARWFGDAADASLAA